MVLTVANDVAFLVFCYGEERGPFDEIVEVEIEVVVFSEGVEVCEVHTEEVLRTKLAEGCHFWGGYERDSAEGLNVVNTYNNQTTALMFCSLLHKLAQKSRSMS